MENKVAIALYTRRQTSENWSFERVVYNQEQADNWALANRECGFQMLAVPVADLLPLTLDAARS